MKKVNVVLGFFFKSKKVVANLHPKLEKLEKEVQAIDAMDNKVEAIVRLFQVLSSLHDEDGFNQEITLLSKYASRKMRNKINALQILQMHVRNAGRCEYGMNRTKKGEAVTPDKVYLGDIYGLWTKTADYWLSEKTRLEKELRLDLSKNPEKPVSTWYLINDCQCGTFVNSHTKGILEQVAQFKAA